MLPAAVDCPTRQPVSQLSAACQRFARETWNPWRRQAAASSDRCFTYETERTGIGNWLPILLDFAKAAADAGGAHLQGTNVPFIADKSEGGTIVCDDRKYA